MKRAIFGQPSKQQLRQPRSNRETAVSESETWAQAILPGSGEVIKSTQSIGVNFVGWTAVVALIVMVVLIAQLFRLQVIQGQRYQALADGNRVRQTVARAPRGAIYDRNNVLLARNVANFDLVAIPARMPKKPAERTPIYSLLGSMLGQTPDELQAIIEKDGKQSPAPVLIRANVERDIALQIEERSRDLAGVNLETNPVREYVDQGLLGHFLGYTGRVSPEDLKNNPTYQQTDLIGKVGLERAYEADLRGQDGAEQAEVDATGKPIKVLASKDSVPGNSAKLTIDFGLEKVFTENLQKQLQASGATRAAGVALNPKNGQIIAVVNLPSYDTNLFARGIKNDDYQTLLKNPDNPLFNKVTSGGYPIGSTIKPFISAAGLQESIISTATTVEDKGKIDVPNIYDPSIIYTFKGWKPEGLGIVNVYKAIAMSSDIFFYYVGGGYQGFKGLGAAKLLKYYDSFGFGRKTGIDSGDEAAGSVPTPDKKKAQTGETWGTGDTYNISIGQGNMMASPLQLAVAVSAVANNGVIYKPHLVDQIIDPQGKLVREIKPEIVRDKIIKSEYLEVVRQGMRQTMLEGTGCCSTNREVPVPVSGKTGTAETSSEGYDKKNQRTKPHSWFEAFAPSDNPEIVIVALIENSGEGAEFALPAVRDTLKWYFTTGKQPR
ncbi:MAG: penicillin-binding protein 2 [bacterium]